MVGKIDETLIKSSQYLMDAAHSFRVCLQKGYTSKNVAVEKPDCGIIYVAKTWPTWQSLILTTLKELYTVSFVLK